MEKFLEYIQEAEKAIQTIDHIVYVTFPLIQDKKLLLKILSETKIAIIKCINSILQYEYLYKRITLYKNPETNLRTFREKCAPRYNINEQEINLMLKLFDVVEKHQQSPFEFVKGNKIVILTENFRPESIRLERIKEFLILAKNILNKTKRKIMINDR